ncbi:MAG: hypothetical protein OXC30_03190 [Alphaproteobacteria bacterium]|nr:hypothetical protein [Alphaproteobacteria bacterium]
MQIIRNIMIICSLTALQSKAGKLTLDNALSLFYDFMVAVFCGVLVCAKEALIIDNQCVE